VFETQLQQLKSAGIPVFECCEEDAPGNGLTLSIQTQKDEAQIGVIEAAWVAADTGGKANALFIGLPSFPILNSIHDNFKSSMATYCKGCKVGELDIALTDIGTTAPSRIVSYLRAHPQVNYVALSYDAEAIGLPAALKSAGITKVKIVGYAPSSVNLQYIANGQQAATVGLPYYEEWWSIADAMARTFVGQSVAPDQVPTPWTLITKANVGNPNKVVPYATNLKTQFKTLWGVS
jgi:ribose transport system substrate-binding protein